MEPNVIGEATLCMLFTTPKSMYWELLHNDEALLLNSMPPHKETSYLNH